MGSTLEFPELTRSDLVYAAKYKRDVKLQAGKKDKASGTHPSWEKRIDYLQKYNFTEELIQKIAEDTGCTDEWLIGEAANFFPDIFLQ